MTTFAAAERARLADLLLEKGPHAPTLCGGWSTRDLAAHLWLRESRPDAFAALFIPPLSRHLDRLTAATKRRDYAEVVREWAAGPSALNPMRAADRHVNAAEHFIHLEDVRRGESATGGSLQVVSGGSGQVRTGERREVGLAWTGAVPGTSLGLVEHLVDGRRLADTLVEVTR